MLDVYLADFTRIAQSCRESGNGFEGFRNTARVIALRWPNDVVEQWLYDHADNGSFLCDYGGVDLSRINWHVEVVSLEDFISMPAGASDGDCIDQYAANPDHWVRVRQFGVHMGVGECWETRGTWKRWPLLIDRQLLVPPTRGLQVVEGRTRVGVLKGRHLNGSLVEEKHLAWVGRADE